MDLIPKCPVKDPCEAATFEEAFSKNLRRYAFELQMAIDLAEAEKADGKEPAPFMDPSFWKGCIAANAKAYEIFKNEFEGFLARVAAQVKSSSSEGDKEWKNGWECVAGTWAKALKDNDPSHIVYW